MDQIKMYIHVIYSTNSFKKRIKKENKRINIKFLIIKFRFTYLIFIRNHIINEYG